MEYHIILPQMVLEYRVASSGLYLKVDTSEFGLVRVEGNAVVGVEWLGMAQCR